MNLPFLEMDNIIEWLCEKMGYKVYRYLPDKATYPFVFLGELFWEDNMTKDVTVGEVNHIIHVYHYHEDVQEAIEILNRINAAIHANRNTENFTWQVKASKGLRDFDGTPSKGTCHVVLDITQSFESKHIGGTKNDTSN